MIEDEVNSTIVDFYKNSKILITGGTGFMGKVLIDKLLRVCSGLDQIFLIIRIKKGKDAQSRLKDLFEDPVSFFLPLMIKYSNFKLQFVVLWLLQLKYFLSELLMSFFIRR